MRDSLIETAIGAPVVADAAFSLWCALAREGEAPSTGDRVEYGAMFSSVSGVSRGTDVRVAGVKVGLVKSISLDTETNEARTVLAVDDKVTLYSDAVARIQTDGILGNAYIGLDPGFDAFQLGPVDPCKSGETLFDGSGCAMIQNTQGSVDLMTLVGSFASQSGDSDGDSGSASGNGGAGGGYPE